MVSGFGGSETHDAEHLVGESSRLLKA